MQSDPNVPKHVVTALSSIARSMDLSMSGRDLIITTAGSWDFDDMRVVAEALGIGDIDIEDRDNGKVERDGEGCSTCGYGSRIRVYGVA